MFTFPSSSARNLLSAIDLRPSLRSLSPDALCQTHVLGHDGDPLRVHRTQIGVLEEADEVRLGRFLKRQQRRGLEPDVDLEVLNNLTNEPLERRLPDEEVGGFLVPTDLSQSNRAGDTASSSWLRPPTLGHWTWNGPPTSSSQPSQPSAATAEASA